MDSKENGSDENDKGEVHVGVQARGGAIGQDRTEHCGDGEDSRACVADAAQLDQGRAAGLPGRARQQAGECRADGDCAASGGERATADGARYSGKGDGVLRQATGLKYAWIERHRTQWPVSLSCEVLGVSPSGYHEHRRRSSKPHARRISNDAFLVHIRAVHAESRGEYGWPRVWKQLLAQGIRVGKQRVRKLMKQHGIRARGKRKFKATTDSNHALPVAPNLLARDFSPAKPNTAWTSDITCIATDEGWLYLVVILDLFNRQVVGWSMKPHMRSELVVNALRMAWFRRRPASGLILHSDRGSQYCGKEFSRAIKAYGMKASMSRKDSLWRSLKVGRLHGMKFATRRAAMDETVDWLTFYNHRRLHSTLGHVSPMQYERKWLADQRRQAA